MNSFCHAALAQLPCLEMWRAALPREDSPPPGVFLRCGLTSFTQTFHKEHVRIVKRLPHAIPGRLFLSALTAGRPLDSGSTRRASFLGGCMQPKMFIAGLLNSSYATHAWIWQGARDRSVSPTLERFHLSWLRACSPWSDRSWIAPRGRGWRQVGSKIHSVRSSLAVKRGRGSGLRVLLFVLECALGMLAVVVVAALTQWSRWLLPVAVLLYLLIVVPTALLSGFWQAVIVSLSAVVVQAYFAARRPEAIGGRPGQLRHAGGLRPGRAHGKPAVRARHRPRPRGRVAGRADARPL